MRTGSHKGSFDVQHPSLKDHVTFMTVAEEEAKAAKRAARENGMGNGEAAHIGSTKGKAKEIAIEELWKRSAGAPLFWEAANVQ